MSEFSLVQLFELVAGLTLGTLLMGMPLVVWAVLHQVDVWVFRRDANRDN